MADNERDDMTSQDDGSKIAPGPNESPDAPLHPRPEAPQQPAGVVPPGGVPLEGGDLLAERRDAEGEDTGQPGPARDRTSDVEEDPVAEGARDESTQDADDRK